MGTTEALDVSLYLAAEGVKVGHPEHDQLVLIGLEVFIAKPLEAGLGLVADGRAVEDDAALRARVPSGSFAVAHGISAGRPAARAACLIAPCEIAIASESLSSPRNRSE